MTTPVRTHLNMLADKGQGSSDDDEIVAEKASSSMGIRQVELPRDRSSKKKGDRDERPTDSKKSRYVYRDYSRVRPTPESLFVQEHQMQQQRDSSSIRSQKLPAKLNAMLSTPEFEHIVGWMPHGRAWKVHSTHLFVQHVMPRFFEYSNYNSFIRLVNAWGFRRLTKGPDRNAYWHELFLRGLPHLHTRMHRLTQHEKKLPLDPEDEPDLYRISELFPLPTQPPPPSDSLTLFGGAGGGGGDASVLAQQLLIQQSNAAAASLFQANFGGPAQQQQQAAQQLEQQLQAGMHRDLGQEIVAGGSQQLGMGGLEAQSTSEISASSSNLPPQQQAMLLRHQQQQLDQLRQLEQLRLQQEQLANMRRLAAIQQQQEMIMPPQGNFGGGISDLQAAFGNSDDLSLLQSMHQAPLPMQQGLPGTSTQQQPNLPNFDPLSGDFLAQLQERNQRQFDPK